MVNNICVTCRVDDASVDIVRQDGKWRLLRTKISPTYCGDCARDEIEFRKEQQAIQASYSRMVFA